MAYIYLRFSNTRRFYVNEYYIFLPLVALIDFIIMRSIQKQRTRTEKLEKLKRELEKLKRRMKLYKIASIALGASTGGLLINRYRGGDTVIDVDYIECGIEEGYRYVDNDRLRKLVASLYPHKERNGVIFITMTAICHLAKLYGLNFPALPIPIQDFGITSKVQFLRKAIVSTLIGAGVPMVLVMETAIWVSIGSVLLGLALMLGSYNLDSVPTTMIDTQAVKQIERRIPDIVEVVSVNLKDTGSDTKIKMPRYECLLPEQKLANPNCNFNSIKATYDQIDIDYNSVVTMRDVTGLDRVRFSDEYSISGNSGKKKSEFPKSKVKGKMKGKMVRFSKKFKDTAIDVDSSTDEVYLRDNLDHKPRKPRIKVEE